MKKWETRIYMSNTGALRKYISCMYKDLVFINKVLSELLNAFYFILLKVDSYLNFHLSLLIFRGLNFQGHIINLYISQQDDLIAHNLFLNIIEKLTF